MKRTGYSRLLGIMAWETKGNPPFAEREDYAAMCRIGSRFGVLVYVFSPNTLNPSDRTVCGYTLAPDGDSWIQRQFPLPDLIYDRLFCRAPGQSASRRASLARLNRLKRVPLLSRRLGGKWEAYEAMKEDPVLLHHLPPTARFAGAAALAERLALTGEAFLKPDGGTQGNGTLHVQREPAGGWRVRGRDFGNRPIEAAFRTVPALAAWVRRLAGGRRYLVQEYLQLRTAEGLAFDIRALMQKNGFGEWRLTGLAARCGRPGSDTSNLHGGGTAEAAGPFLAREFGRAEADRLLAKLRELAEAVPPALERRFGEFAELGVDIGVDRGGRLWILEANARPGRSAFRQIGDGTAQAASIRRPVAYARYLMDRQHICL